MLNLVSLSTQSLASCVNYFVWNCLTCFSNTKIGSVTSFSILFNFQGPVRLSLAADDLFIVPPKWFFVKPYFLEAFELSELGHSRSFSEQTGTFQRLLVLFKGFVLRLQKSFFCLSAWRSHIVPHLRGFGKPFFKVFFAFFAFVYKNQFFAPDLPGFRAGLPILSYYKRAAVQAPCTAAPRVQLFSSCFICRRVSQTATASTGSMPIRPMGIGPNTV